MQLKPPRLRQALSTAAGMLLSTTALAGAATEGSDTAELASTADDWRLDTGYLRYEEEDRIAADTLLLFARKQVAEEKFLGLRLVLDTVSGASPTGTTPLQAVSLTGSSGTAPFANFDSERMALGVDWEQPVSERSRITTKLDYSDEEGYTSRGAGLSFAHDSAQKLTTWTLGGNYTRDSTKPEGGIPAEMICLCNLVIVAPSATKSIGEVQLGLSQVLGRKTLAQFSLTHSQSWGYLSNPYKLLSVVHPITGETITTGVGGGTTVLQPYTERRPDERHSNILFAQVNQTIGRDDVLYVSARYYEDDWDIRSGTIDLKYRWQVSPTFYLQPRLRYYTQGKASFYRPVIIDGNIPAYGSADYRLAEMQGISFGIKAGWRLATDGELTARLESGQQTGDSHPDGTVGVQDQVDFFPEIDVTTFQVGYTTWF